MCDSVPIARYSPICNVLRQWKTLLIPIYRVYRLYGINSVLGISAHAKYPKRNGFIVYYTCIRVLKSGRAESPKALLVCTPLHHHVFKLDCSAGTTSPLLFLFSPLHSIDTSYLIIIVHTKFLHTCILHSCLHASSVKIPFKPLISISIISSCMSSSISCGLIFLPPSFSTTALQHNTKHSVIIYMI